MVEPEARNYGKERILRRGFSVGSLRGEEGLLGTLRSREGFKVISFRQLDTLNMRLSLNQSEIIKEEFQDTPGLKVLMTPTPQLQASGQLRRLTSHLPYNTDL